MNSLLLPTPFPTRLPPFHHPFLSFPPPFHSFSSISTTATATAAPTSLQSDIDISPPPFRHDFIPLLNYLSNSAPDSLNPTESQLADSYRSVPTPLWHSLLKSLSSSATPAAAYSLAAFLHRHNLSLSPPFHLLHSIHIHSLPLPLLLHQASLLSNHHTLSPLTYSALISAAARSHDLPKTLSLISQMRRHSLPLHLLNFTFIIQSIAATASAGDSSSLLRFLNEIETQKFEFDSHFSNELVVAFAKAGDVDTASRFLSMLQANGFSPKTATLLSVVSALGSLGRAEGAEAVFEEIKDGGLKPRTRAYNAVLKAYVKAGMLKDAEFVVSEMERVGVLGDERTYSLLIDAYTNAGECEDRVEGDGIEWCETEFIRV